MNSLKSIFLLVATLSLLACGPRLAQDVRSNIENHPNLGAHDLTIANQRSTVTLSGKVGTEAARAEIERLTWQTPGVEKVKNKIRVSTAISESNQNAKTVSPQANRILKAVKAERSIATPYNLQVGIVGSRAFLDGTVAKQSDIQAIERITLKQPNISSVENRLRLTEGVSDKDISSSLQDLSRQFNSEGLKDLNFTVNSGKITVKGKANNHTTIDRLLTELTMLKGVNEITNEITINGKPYMEAWKDGHRATSTKG